MEAIADEPWKSHEADPALREHYMAGRFLSVNDANE
jgi:hypothetical protein